MDVLLLSTADRLPPASTQGCCALTWMQGMDVGSSLPITAAASRQAQKVVYGCTEGRRECMAALSWHYTAVTAASKQVVLSLIRSWSAPAAAVNGAWDVADAGTLVHMQESTISSRLPDDLRHRATPYTVLESSPQHLPQQLPQQGASHGKRLQAGIQAASGHSTPVCNGQTGHHRRCPAACCGAHCCKSCTQDGQSQHSHGNLAADGKIKHSLCMPI